MSDVDLWKERLVGQIDFLRGDFTLASGKKSDFYINGKTTTLRPEALYLAANIFLAQTKGMGATRVGGLTLGADALIGAIVALSWINKTPLPGFIVRKETKDYGTGQGIEGPPIEATDRVIVIEDVVTTGGSALKAVERVRAAQPGADMIGVWALVDRLDGGEAALKAEGLTLMSVFTRDDLL